MLEVFMFNAWGKYCFTNVSYFSKIPYHTQLEDSVFDSTSGTSAASTSVILIDYLLVV